MNKQDNISNWAEKKAFVNFIVPFNIHSIYIDEYWDYYIKEYNLENLWNQFLKDYQFEKNSYEKFKDNYYKTIFPSIDTIKKIFNENNLSEKCENLLIDNTEINQYIINKESLSDGTYICVSLFRGFDQAMKYVYDDYTSVFDIIKNNSKSNIFNKSDKTRLEIIYYLNRHIINYMYQISNEIILEKLYKSNNPIIEKINEQFKLIGKTNRDTLIYASSNIENINDILGHYDNFYVNTLTVKTIKMFGNDCKCLITRDKDNKISNFDLYHSDKQLNTSIYPFALKLALGEELNDKDLTFGYEDEIFFKFDKSEIV